MFSKKKTSTEYEQLGRAVSAVFESGYLDKKMAYKTSFIKGVFSGLGGVIGATIVLALLLWILTLFSRVPLIGGFIDKAQHSIQQSKK